MGKRKRSGEENEKTSADLDSDPQPPPEKMPCSAGTKALSKEKSSSLADSGELKHSSTSTDGMDTFVKLSNIHSSLAMYQSRRPRHYYRHQYMRRNVGKYTGASSTSHGKSNLRDERLSLKLPDHREVALKKPDRIKSSLSGMDPLKTVCSLCQKLLRRKPYCLGDSLSSGEYAAVAVLVCGHIYHADCLEDRTELEDRHDPPCPICSQEASKGPE